MLVFRVTAQQAWWQDGTYHFIQSRVRQPGGVEGRSRRENQRVRSLTLFKSVVISQITLSPAEPVAAAGVGSIERKADILDALPDQRLFGRRAMASP